eukprot:CAMPEP_0185155784 /NCGR_PEP_ID=MMETSP1139-20130426/664_1 /TAXON_ID=298111 /ORGANISM="Pavlova sp., Strain CCMP459" /LENGTH=93 /DNA_ID=CAMNT_0027720713 /DNA_START=895 /DNA_END=1176 /DNA_ORIENTATION=-
MRFTLTEMDGEGQQEGEADDMHGHNCGRAIDIGVVQTVRFPEHVHLVHEAGHGRERATKAKAGGQEPLLLERLCLDARALLVGWQHLGEHHVN